MAIKKIGDRYRVNVDVGIRADGKRDRRQATFGLLREAKAQEAEWLSLKRRKAGIVTGMTLGEFVEHVFWEGKSHLDDGTLMGYRRDVNNRILPMLGNIELASIRKSDVQALISSCPTNKTARNAHDTLSSILGWAVQLDYIETNPASGKWTYPKKEPRLEGSDGAVLQSFAEISSVLDAVKGDAAEPIFLLGLGLGLRKGEILALEWEDVDLSSLTAHIRSTYTAARGGMKEKVTKTEKSTRDIPISKSLAARLEALGPSTGPIVCSGGGRIASATATKRVSRAVEELGIPRVTCKSMRHSFATSCIKAGMDVSVLSRILGHNNVSTTYNRYVRPQADALREGMGVVEF